MPTKIEWTQETWNPITGCSKISEGCANCYAERMAKRLAGRFGYPDQPHHFDVTIHEDKFDQPLKWKKPRMIFVCSMGDLFHDDVPEEQIMRVFDVMCDAPQHTYQILTKRPQRMKWIVKQFTDYIWKGLPENIWLGVTAENQKAADERIPWLLKTPAAVRFVSIEPMLGPISFRWAKWQPIEYHNHLDGLRMLDWIICGGETGPGARRMNYTWAINLYGQCMAADVPFFFKKVGNNPDPMFEELKPMFTQIREWPTGYTMP